MLTLGELLILGGYFQYGQNDPFSVAFSCEQSELALGVLTASEEAFEGNA